MVLLQKVYGYIVSRRFRKKTLESESLLERKTFDKMFRSRKRSYQRQRQQWLLDKYNYTDSGEVWKAIWNSKIGIVNDMGGYIFWEVIENGAIVSDKKGVLEKWQSDYYEIYNGHRFDQLL